MKKLILTALLSVTIAAPAAAQCVTQGELSVSLNRALGHWAIGPTHGVLLYTTECNPCKCPSGEDWDLECAKYEARQRKDERALKAQDIEILKRLSIYGVCK